MTRCWSRGSRSRRQRTRCATPGRHPCSSTASRRPGTSARRCWPRGVGGPGAVGAAARRRRGGRSVRPVRRASTRSSHSPRLMACRSWKMPPRRWAVDLQGSPGRNARRVSGKFSFNGNKIMTTSGGGAFVSPDSEVCRSCPLPRDAGAAAAGAALRARRRRVQLSPQQSVGGAGSGPAGRLPRDVGEAAADQRLLSGTTRRRRRSVVHADRAVGRMERLVDVCGVRRPGPCGMASRAALAAVAMEKAPTTVEADAPPAGVHGRHRHVSTGRASACSSTASASRVAASSPTPTSSGSRRSSPIPAGDERTHRRRCRRSSHRRSGDGEEGLDRRPEAAVAADRRC